MYKKYAAEGIGAFALCFVGILAITGAGITGADGAANLASIGLAHGLTIAVMIAALGAVSGGHFNSAVTFGFVVSGRMSPIEGVRYCASQVLGGLVAATIIAAMFGADVVAGGTPALSGEVSTISGIVIEAIATFFLVLVVFGTAVDERAPKSIYPLAIGLTVALDIMAFGTLTGAAMNPARVLGPAVAGGEWGAHLIYWIGPLAGGALAALVYEFVIRDRTVTVPVPEVAAPAAEPA